MPPTVGTMAHDVRSRFARLVREPDADLAELALCCGAALTGEVDVDAELARVDELAGLLDPAEVTGQPRAEAAALSALLAGELGFHGDEATYHDPRNGLLHETLARRRGLPITLAILYVAVARRVGIRAHGCNTPGHFLVAVGEGSPPPVLIDAFDRGALLDPADVAARIPAVGEVAGGLAQVLRPASPVTILRRVLANQVRDLQAAGELGRALTAVELTRLLPDSGSADVDQHARLLLGVGRFQDAAALVDDHLAAAEPPEPAATELARLARAARARLN